MEIDEDNAYDIYRERWWGFERFERFEIHNSVWPSREHTQEEMVEMGLTYAKNKYSTPIAWS